MDTEVQRAYRTLERAGYPRPITTPADILPVIVDMLERQGYMWLAYTQLDNGVVNNLGLRGWCRAFYRIHRLRACNMLTKADGTKHEFCDLDEYADSDYGADQLGNGSLWGIEHGMESMTFHLDPEGPGGLIGYTVHLYYVKP